LEQEAVIKQAAYSKSKHVHALQQLAAIETVKTARDYQALRDYALKQLDTIAKAEYGRKSYF
jgi:hypothetical protein